MQSLEAKNHTGGFARSAFDAFFRVSEGAVIQFGGGVQHTNMSSIARRTQMGTNVLRRGLLLLRRLHDKAVFDARLRVHAADVFSSHYQHTGNGGPYGHVFPVDASDLRRPHGPGENRKIHLDGFIGSNCVVGRRLLSR